MRPAVAFVAGCVLGHLLLDVGWTSWGVFEWVHAHPLGSWEYAWRNFVQSVGSALLSVGWGLGALEVEACWAKRRRP